MRASLIVVALALSALAFVGSDAAQVGPLSSISCDAGSVVIAPGDNAPAIVWGKPAGTSFCFKAGVHQPSAPINVRDNERFIAEYGAILDGGLFQQTDDSTSIIRCWSATCNNVTVRNFTIRNLPHVNCIGNYWSNGWTVDHNEITGCRYGLNFGYSGGHSFTFNNVHNNFDVTRPDYSGGYGGNLITDSIFEGNRFDLNGPTQKLNQTTNVTFRNNTFSPCGATGIWYDGDNTGGVIEGNLLEDCSGVSIFYEVSGPATIRNNTIRRAGDTSIFVSTSRDLDIYGNTIEDGYRGITTLVQCGVVGTGLIGYDLRNVSVHDNAIRIPDSAFALATGLSQQTCTDTQFAPYVNGSKGITFARNTYSGNNLSGAYWFWGNNPYTQFGQWQAVPQDATGSFRLIGSVPAPTPDPVPTPVPPPSDLAAPVVTFPVPSGIRRKSKVKLTASATDDVGVASLQILVNGAVCGSGVPFASCTWGVPAAPGRSYDLQAVATDAAGHKAIVLVTVNPQ